VIAVVVVSYVAALMGSTLPLHARAALNTIVAMGGAALFLAATWGVDARPGRGGAPVVTAGLVSGVGFGLFGTGALTVIHGVFPATVEQRAGREAMYQSLVQADSAAMMLVVFVVVAVLPGIFEEWLFRGVLRERLASIRSPLPHALNGLAFALIHADVAGFAPYLVVGAGLSLLAVQQGGWRATAIAHVALNTLNALVLPRLLGTDPGPDWIGPAMLGGGLGVACGPLVAMWVTRRTTQ
jgi:membrane protease YdiL (CAAX protease family)